MRKAINHFHMALIEIIWKLLGGNLNILNLSSRDHQLHAFRIRSLERAAS